MLHWEEMVSDKNLIANPAYISNFIYSFFSQEST